MLAFCKGTLGNGRLSRSNPLRTRTWKGLSTIDRIQVTAPIFKPRPLVSWILGSDADSPVEKARSTLKGTISAPLPLTSSPPWMLSAVTFPTCPISPIPTTSHFYRPKNRGTDASYRIRSAAAPLESRPISRIRLHKEGRRPELPWPTPPLPSTVDLQTVSSSSSTSSSTSTVSTSSSCYSVEGDLSEDSYDDGLETLSVLLRRISYDAISASTIHHHLGYMEDGGRVLPLGRVPPNAVRYLSPARRYSSLMGVSLAIMEGKLPKALIL